MKKLCACGRPDCAVNKAMNEALDDMPPELQEMVENGDAIMVPAGPDGRPDLSGLLGLGGMSDRDPLSSLLPMLMGSGLGNNEVSITMVGPDGAENFRLVSGPDGVSVEETSLDEDGTVRNRIQGYAWEDVLEDEMSPAVMGAYAKVVEARKEVDKNRKRLAELCKSVEKETEQLGIDRELFKHLVWEKLPNHFGKTGLKIAEERGRVILCNHYGDHIEVIDQEHADDLFEHQEALNQREVQLELDCAEIDRLKLREQHGPEKIKALLRAADSTLMREQPEVALLQAKGEVRIGVLDGHIVVKRQVPVFDETDVIPDHMQEILATAADQDPKEVQLPPFLRKALGMSENAPEQTEIDTEEVPAGAPK